MSPINHTAASITKESHPVFFSLIWNKITHVLLEMREDFAGLQGNLTNVPVFNKKIHVIQYKSSAVSTAYIIAPPQRSIIDDLARNQSFQWPRNELGEFESGKDSERHPFLQQNIENLNKYTSSPKLLHGRTTAIYVTS